MRTFGLPGANRPQHPGLPAQDEDSQPTAAEAFNCGESNYPALPQSPYSAFHDAK